MSALPSSLDSQTSSPLDSHEKAIINECVQQQEARVLVEGGVCEGVVKQGEVDRVVTGLLRGTQLCAACEKTRYVGMEPRRRSWVPEKTTPVHHCACMDGGVVERADEWAVQLYREARTHRPGIRLVDPTGSMDFFYSVVRPGFPYGQTMEWGEVSLAARELATALLNLVVGVRRAEAMADAFVRTELATLDKYPPSRGYWKLTLPKLRQWVSKHDEQVAA